jgi:hypothetical protein
MAIQLCDVEAVFAVLEALGNLVQNLHRSAYTRTWMYVLYVHAYSTVPPYLLWRK